MPGEDTKNEMSKIGRHTQLCFRAILLNIGYMVYLGFAKEFQGTNQNLSLFWSIAHIFKRYYRVLL